MSDHSLYLCMCDHFPPTTTNCEKKTSKYIDGPDLHLDLRFDQLQKKQLSFDGSKPLHFNLQIRGNSNILQLEKARSVVVSFFGRFSTGKTTIVKKLNTEIEKRTLKVGITATTSGLDFYTYIQNDRNFIVVDSEGMNSPLTVQCNDDDIQKVMCKEFMVREISQDISDIIMFVTRQYCLEDELSIAKLVKANKLVYVIHNPYSLSTLDQLAEYVDQLKLEGSRSTFLKKLIDKKKDVLFKSFDEMGGLDIHGVKHYFFFNDNESIGNKWNETVVQRLIIQISEFGKIPEEPQMKFREMLRNSFLKNVKLLLDAPVDMLPEKDNRLDQFTQNGFWIMSNGMVNVTVNWINPLPTITSLQSRMRGCVKSDQHGRFISIEACLPPSCLKLQCTPSYLKVNLLYDKYVNETYGLHEGEFLKEIELDLHPIEKESRIMIIEKKSNEVLTYSLAWVIDGRLNIFIPKDSKSNIRYVGTLEDELMKKDGIRFVEFEENDS